MLRFVTHDESSRPELRQDFVIGREAAGLVFRVDPLPVDGDIEDSAAPLDQFRLDSRTLLNCFRQTGGIGQVVSLHAVGDGDLHRWAFSETAARLL